MAAEINLLFSCPLALAAVSWFGTTLCQRQILRSQIPRDGDIMFTAAQAAQFNPGCFGFCSSRASQAEASRLNLVYSVLNWVNLAPSCILCPETSHFLNLVEHGHSLTNANHGDIHIMSSDQVALHHPDLVRS